MAEFGSAKTKNTKTAESDSGKKKTSSSSRPIRVTTNSESNKQASGDAASTSAAEGETKEKTVVIAIDLTDPEDLLAKLAVLHLSETEEEQLLQDAYRINKKLKEELSKQEFDDMKITRSYTISASSASFLESQRRRPVASSRPQSKKASAPATTKSLNLSPYKAKTGTPVSAKKKAEHKSVEPTKRSVEEDTQDLTPRSTVSEN